MRRALLWLGLAGVLVATYNAPGADDGGVVAPAGRAGGAAPEKQRAAPQNQRAAAQPPDLQIRRRVEDDELGNVFATQSWAAPAAPISPAAPAPADAAAAQAPPLPFRFLGRLVDDGASAYFLQINERNLVLRPGDAVDQTYTLDSASGGTLTFTYLPLNQQQTLVVGEAN